MVGRLANVTMISGTLGVATFLYIAASLVLTGMVPYTEVG